MQPTTRAGLVAGRGIVDNINQGGRRQVTIISRERWNIVVKTLGVQLPPSARRANILVSGVDLENAAGRVLCIGECRVLLRGETLPCERMDEAYQGLREALAPHWSGGAYGEVVSGGEIAIGDAVLYEAQER